MKDLNLAWRRLELLRIRWKLINGLAPCDPETLPAAVDWIDSQLAEMH